MARSPTRALLVLAVAVVALVVAAGCSTAARPTTGSGTTAATAATSGSDASPPRPSAPGTSGPGTSGPGTGGAGTDGRTPPPSTTSPTTATPTPAVPPTFATRTTTGVVDDVARGRTLRFTAYHPDAPGPFPLAVFSHGYRLPGDGYDRVLSAVARHGYVVVAPEHPHTTAHEGDGNRNDLTNQPADLTFLTDQVVAGIPGVALPAIAPHDRIAALGHSDGGLTATAFGYGPQFRDPRVAAVVSMTGGVALFPGAFFTGDDPPVLAIHARDDSTNPYSASVNLVRALPAGPARFLLSIDSGNHIEPYMFATGRPELGDAIAAFLDLTVRADPTAAERLRATVAAHPDLTLDEG